MGILPLHMPSNWSAKEMQIVASDTIEIGCDIDKLVPRCAVSVTLRRAQSEESLTVEATALLDTAREIQLIQSGGIIPMILQRALAVSHARTGNTAA